jgi:hypothetical protein
MADDREAAEEQPEPPHRIGATDYVAPMLGRKAFHCPHCAVYSPQGWRQLKVPGVGVVEYSGTHAYRGECFNCHDLTYWLARSTVETMGEQPDALMVYPAGSGNAPPPHPHLPTDPKADYEEARGIVDRSPRGATALLRLAVQKLCAALGEPGKDVNTDIASLVQKGLPPGVQQALDSLRVIGNNAVHPGQMDMRDDRDTAVALFGLLNFIVEQMITRPNELQAIYAKLPPGAVAAIQKRDAEAEGE